jgi:hypothetical protein
VLRWAGRSRTGHSITISVQSVSHRRHCTIRLTSTSASLTRTSYYLCRWCGVRVTGGKSRATYAPVRRRTERRSPHSSRAWPRTAATKVITATPRAMCQRNASAPAAAPALINVTAVARRATIESVRAKPESGGQTGDHGGDHHSGALHPPKKATLCCDQVTAGSTVQNRASRTPRSLTRRGPAGLGSLVVHERGGVGRREIFHPRPCPIHTPCIGHRTQHLPAGPGW